MRVSVCFVFFSLLIIFWVSADVYLHNPRGSNDRNCERSQNRANANRLFDSQNNAQGGYACPRAVGGPEKQTEKMTYYGTSQLTIEWTNQHACGDNNQVNCDIIIQYMCGDKLRDGTPLDGRDAATDTIPLQANPANAERYGLHESYEYYEDCQTRRRTTTLYTADQNLNQGTAVSTRQNPNGDRYGYECSEERDYYPYWFPSPWKDIAVLTRNTSRCTWFRRESQNVKGRGHCVEEDGSPSLYNNMYDCTHPDPTINEKSSDRKWVVDPPHNIAPPECQQAPWTRINHLGNSRGGYASQYNWTIPNIDADSCVLRIRYNISTHDFNQLDGLNRSFVDNSFNGEKAPLLTDPFVSLGGQQYLALAVNTNQYGRTFQDRSYVFSIRKRPLDLPSESKIYNLNVRGKRGNIVQVYPAVEYGFIPDVLYVKNGDYIHYQWTGSDYNPPYNDGEGGPQDPVNPGQTGADRSNIIEIPCLNHNVPTNMTELYHKSMFLIDKKFGTNTAEVDMNLIMKLAYLHQENCLSLEELENIPPTQREIDPQNCFKLNAASTPYFNGGLVKMLRNGEFYYMCSRNNDFSNRDQKGTIIVSEGDGDGEVINPSVDRTPTKHLSSGWTVFIVFVVLTSLLASVAGLFWYQERRKRLERRYSTDLSDLNESLLQP